MEDQARRPFTVNSFSVMLKNQTYIGTYTFKDEITVEGAVPAIVDRATFDKVGTMLERNRRAPGRVKAKEEYQLQGKVFCGYCGAPMVGESGRGRRGATYHYYACATRKKAHTCQKKNEKKGFLEWYVVEQITTHILTDQRIHEIAAGWSLNITAALTPLVFGTLKERSGPWIKKWTPLWTP